MINSALKNIPNYLGTMSWGDFILIKTLPKDGFSVVLNLDAPGKPGTHWVSVYDNKKNSYVLYLDSFGFPPPDELRMYLEKMTNKMVMYSEHQLQKDLSEKCGYFCIDMLTRLNKGESIESILKNVFTPRPSNHNEQEVI